MDEVALDNVCRPGGEGAVKCVNRVAGRPGVVAQRINRVLRYGIHAGAGRRKNSTAYDRGGDVGISRDVADEVAGSSHVGAAGLDSVHGIAADNVVSNRVGGGATDDVVVNSNVLARRPAQKNSSETGSRSGPAVVDRDRADAVVRDDIEVLEAEIEYPFHAYGVCSNRCRIDNDTR